MIRLAFVVAALLAAFAARASEPGLACFPPGWKHSNLCFASNFITLSSLRDASQGDIALAAHCAAVRDDDVVRPYDASLQAGVVAAFSRLFPNARTPDEQQLRAGAHLRCMDGRLLACFTGANLPCGKLNAVRDNRGAAAFCADNPNAQVVPAFATGHDAAFLYRCVGGQAEISGETFVLDRRGFAAELWAPVE